MKLAKMAALLFWMSATTCFFFAAKCVNGFSGHYAFHGDLTAATVQVSDWLIEHYHGNFKTCEPHIISSMMVSLRLAGHHPKTLLSQFKAGSNSTTILDYLKAYLDKHQRETQRLSSIPAGQLAFIVQGLLALCQNPQDFFGHNLTKALKDSFAASGEVLPDNYFTYNAIVLALCQSGITDVVYEKDLNGVGHTTFPDTTAMAVMALSCLKKNANTSHNYYDTLLERLINMTIHSQQQNQSGWKSWNVHSISFVVQALMTSPSRLKPKQWKMMMKRILKKQDDAGSFGNMLANIQVIPALVGRSLVTLTDLSCPHDSSSGSHSGHYKKNITVCVKLIIRQDGPTKMLARLDHLNVPENTTAFEILKLAAKQDEKFKFSAKKSSFGRMITAISNLKQNATTGFYWMLYSDDSSLVPNGVDIFTPNNNTCVVFKYEKYGQQHDDDDDDVNFTV